MADLKREYIVPLRRKIKTAPIWRRSKKAVSVLKDFMRQHMKAENVVICAELNEYIWKNGSKNPPGKVEVVALKTDVNGVESTVVNLQSVGVDAQMATYVKVESVASKTEKKAEVQDAEVKEVEVKEEVVEERQVEKTEKKTAKKAEIKKEAKEE